MEKKKRSHIMRTLPDGRHLTEEEYENYNPMINVCIKDDGLGDKKFKRMRLKTRVREIEQKRLEELR